MQASEAARRRCHPFARNATERLDGFTAAMAEVADAVPLVTNGDFTAEDGGRAAHPWMDAAPEPTTVIAVNDSVALGALEALPTELLLRGSTEGAPVAS